MRTKIFTLLFAMIANTGTILSTTIASGTFGEEGANLSWALSNDSVLTISGTGNMPNIAPWMSYQSAIAYVIIQDGVSSIGEYAFRECSNIKSAEIPNSVTFIGGHAFERCTNLVIINIPNSVTSIGSYVFRDCDNLLTPQYNEKIFAYLPASYAGAYSVPEGIETIAGGAFAWCEELTSLQLPQSLIEIGGNGAISRCKKLTSITIPKKVINIGKQAFGSDTQLTSITFQSHMPATIGQNAFPSCDLFVPCNTLEAYQSAWTTYASQIKYAPNQSFQLVTYPINQVTSELISGGTSPCDEVTYSLFANAMDGYRFSQWSDGGNDNPRIVTLTQDTTFTAEFVEDCLLLSEIRGDSIKWELSCDSILIIEGNGTWGGSEQFSSATNKNAVKKVIIKDGVKRIGAMSFMGMANIVSIDIPNSVTSVGDAAFGHCSSLASITLPTNLTTLGKRAFNACTSLTTIVWNAKNCYAYTDDNTYTSFYSVQGNITTFVIGDSVEYLPSGLCNNMNNLSSVHISDIASWCNINFTNSKTSNPLYYAHHLYLNNEEIINLVIPEGVTEISNRAFAGYSAMKTISIPSTVVRIGHTAFDGCTGLTSVVIPDGVTTIGNEAFTRCNNLQSVIVGDNVTTIGEGVFTKCTSLTSPIYNSHTFFFMPTSYSGAYLVPDGVKTIAGSAFYQCKELTSIDIPNSVMVLGEAAFRECSKLEEITVGTGVTALSKNVFNKCANIKKVQWNAINYRQKKPNSDSNCFPFYGSRDSITSFTFGDSVEYIPVYLLKDFSAIHSLVIPASVTEIGEYAFTNDSLVEITCLAETPPTIDSTAVVGVNKSTCVLYVPYTSVNAYRNTDVWKEFVNIREIGAEEVEEPEDNIVVTPSNTSASLIWALISNAVTYELVIRDMNGNVICTLTFNAWGQLTGIAFAPNRSREAQQTQAAGFQFTVSGLNSGTTYEYTLTAYDENENVIETLTGTFTTTNDVITDIEQMHEDTLNIPRKIIRDGNVYILRGEKVFTLQGQEVK